jgi:hypothetical protein
MLGEDKGRELWSTALWFEGRMLKEGEVGGIAGGGICAEVRLEVLLEVRRGDEARGRGEGGIVFRSGAILVSRRNERIKYAFETEVIAGRRNWSAWSFARGFSDGDAVQRGRIDRWD